jgi:glycerol-3-phosphate acyltransferase PlsY
MLHLLGIATAYLLGSIPFGYLIVRLVAGADVRETGSGGTGATNVTRRAGKLAGVATLLLDAAKGAAAVALARWLFAPDHGVNWWVAAAALAAVVGHIFPVWLGFRGGKGVATGLGAFAVLSPAAVLCAAVVFLAVVWRTRYVSLGSITAAAALPVCVWLLDAGDGPPAHRAPLVTAAVLGSAIIIAMHHANIGRLARGTESKFR